MTVVAAVSIPSDSIKIRWREPFLSAGLNRKAHGTSLRGVYRGFDATASAPATITLQVEQPKLGTGDSLSAVSGTTQVLIDVAGLFSPEDAAKSVTITGAVNGVNNGTFQISRFVSPTRIEIQNSVGVAETSSFSWSINPFAVDSVAVLDDPSQGYTTTVRYDANVTLNAAGLPLPLATNAAASGTGGDLSALSAGKQTLTDAGANWTSAEVGRYITIVGALSGNNGTFLITRFIAATQIEFFNPTGVAQVAGAFTWSVVQRNWVILDVDYRQGVSSSGSIRLVNAVSDLAAQPHSVRICRLDIPTNAATLSASYVVQVRDADPINPDVTTRPWASDTHSGAAFPGYRPQSILDVSDYSGLGAVTQVTLSGKFFVGFGATGTANKYFAFAAQTADSSQQQLLGANQNAITVNRIINPVTNAEVVPNIDAEVDLLGFIANPKVEANFSTVVEVDFSATDPRVLAYKYTTAGLLTPNLTSTEPIRSFMRPALDVPSRNFNYITLPASTNVQVALEDADERITASRQRIVTVGPVGSHANFEGNTHAVFVSALADLGASGGTVLVYPTVYNFGATVVISAQGVTIKGVKSGFIGNDIALRKGDAFRDALFSMTDIGGVVFEDLVFDDAVTAGGVLATAAQLVQNVSAVSPLEGMKVRRCYFISSATDITKVWRQIECNGSGAGAGSNIKNLEITNCKFDSAGNDVSIRLTDISSFDISNNRQIDSRSQNLGFIFSTNSNFSTGGTHTADLKVANNKINLPLGLSTADSIHLEVPGGSGAKSKVAVTGNLIQNISGGGADAAIWLSPKNSADLTNHSVWVLDNQIDWKGNYCVRVSATAGQPLGSLAIRGNTFTGTTNPKPFFNVGAFACSIEHNQFTGGAPHFIISAFKWFDDTIAGKFVFADNAGTMVGDFAEPIAVSFPANARVSGNHLIRTRTAGGSFGTLISAAAGCVFEGNIFDCTHANLTTAGDNVMDIAGNNVLVRGSHFLGTLNVQDGVTSSVVVLGTQLVGCHLEGLRYAVLLSAGSRRLQVESCLFRTFMRGVRCSQGAATTVDAQVVGNNFIFNHAVDDAAAGVGLGVELGNLSAVSGNHFRDLTATAGDAGIRKIVSCSSGTSITANTFENLLSVSTVIGAGSRNTVSGNIIGGVLFDAIGKNNTQAVDNSAIIAITVGGNSTVTGNSIDNIGNGTNTGQGIYFVGTGRVTITGNLIDGIVGGIQGTVVIDCSNANRATVFGNISEGPGTGYVIVDATTLTYGNGTPDQDNILL